MSQAEQRKKLESDAFLANRLQEAVAHYGEATELAASFTNVAVAWAALGDWQRARDNAEHAMQLPRGLTAETLFQKVRAELKLEDINAAEQTMALTNRCGLSREVKEMLAARSLSIPEAAKTHGSTSDAS